MAFVRQDPAPAQLPVTFRPPAHRLGCMDSDLRDLRERSGLSPALIERLASADCFNCGKSVKKSLSQRTHRCSHCGFVLDRDWNAALNILELALRTVGHTGMLNASFDIDLCLGEEAPLSKPSRGKRKPKK